jgi:hypothetical protein
VSLGADDVMDPWYSLGTGNALDVAHMAVHVAHMTGRAEVDETFEMVTERAAAALGLGDRYGLAPGRPASFVVLQAADRFDAVRRRLPPRLGGQPRRGRRPGPAGGEHPDVARAGGGVRGVRPRPRRRRARGLTAVRVAVLSSSPRRDGNSRLLADAAAEGAAAAGHDVE